ncbi:MAG: hypothetical protein H8E64_02405 [Candidatus Marinimicrobia bacterium]|nr:hypothetical protein [Candidatus Neomarinimicrobiota bacterium]
MAALSLFPSCESDTKILAGYQNGEELEEGDLIPFLLHQNFPNPFNPRTSIRFDVGKSLHLTMKVYTDDWQEVSKLVDDEFDENTFHTVIFQGINSDGEEVPSGSYFYTLEGGGVILIRKMTVLK